MYALTFFTFLIMPWTISPAIDGLMMPGSNYMSRVCFRNLPPIAVVYRSLMSARTFLMARVCDNNGVINF
jgi:hypothetical protein